LPSDNPFHAPDQRTHRGMAGSSRATPRLRVGSPAEGRAVLLRSDWSPGRVCSKVLNRADRPAQGCPTPVATTEYRRVPAAAACRDLQASQQESARTGPTLLRGAWRVTTRPAVPSSSKAPLTNTAARGKGTAGGTIRISSCVAAKCATPPMANHKRRTPTRFSSAPEIARGASLP
jgi:hypothetical protein